MENIKKYILDNLLTIEYHKLEDLLKSLTLNDAREFYKVIYQIIKEPEYAQDYNSNSIRDNIINAMNCAHPELTLVIINDGYTDDAYTEGKLYTREELEAMNIEELLNLDKCDFGTQELKFVNNCEILKSYRPYDDSKIPSNIIKRLLITNYYYILRPTTRPLFSMEASYLIRNPKLRGLLESYNEKLIKSLNREILSILVGSLCNEDIYEILNDKTNLKIISENNLNDKNLIEDIKNRKIKSYFADMTDEEKLEYVKKSMYFLKYIPVTKNFLSEVYKYSNEINNTLGKHLVKDMK